MADHSTENTHAVAPYLQAYLLESLQALFEGPKRNDPPSTVHCKEMKDEEYISLIRAGIKKADAQYKSGQRIPEHLQPKRPTLEQWESMQQELPDSGHSQLTEIALAAQIMPYLKEAHKEELIPVSQQRYTKKLEEERQKAKGATPSR